MAFYYTIYDAKTDELLAYGDSFSCAKALGLSMSYFYTMITRCRHGACKKYAILVEPLNDELDETDTILLEPGVDRFVPPPRIDYARVQSLYNEGLTDKEIAEKLGCNKSKVWEWRTKRGLPSHSNRGKHDLNAVEQLYRRGYSDTMISRELSIPAYVVTQWRNRHGYTRNRSKAS